VSARLKSVAGRQALVSVACGLALLAAGGLALTRLQRALPGTPTDRPGVRFTVKADESVWQQFWVPYCQPVALSFSLAEPVSTRGALSATFFTPDERTDRWTDVADAVTTVAVWPGQTMVRVPFPGSFLGRRRLVRVKLTPRATVIAFQTVLERWHDQQYVLRRQGYVATDSLVFVSDYAGGQSLASLRCVAEMQFPGLQPAVLCGAIVTVCVVGGYMCGLAWRLTQRAAQQS
jgi:hypothetical protein